MAAIIYFYSLSLSLVNTLLGKRCC